MVKKQIGKGNSILYYLSVILIIVAVGISSGWQLSLSDDPEVTVDKEIALQLFPKTKQIIQQDEHTYFFKSRRDTIGTGILAGAYGYGGKVPLLIGIRNEKISKIHMYPNHETEEFLTYIANDSLLQKWEGMPVASVLDTKIDAVSGASISSDAIIDGVRKGIAIYLNESNGGYRFDMWSVVQDVLFLLTIGAALLMAFFKPAKKYRTAFLISVLLIIGILTGKVLSVKLMYGWVSNGISWRANWYSAILLVLALVMPILKKPMFYCAYLCPMGAFQELINKYTPFKRKSIKVKWKKISLNEVYLTLIWSSLILGFTPELSHLEPFMVFSYKVVGFLFFVAALVIGVLSLFFNKPWCSVCPTGCLLETVSYKKSRA